ncbi:peroxiredoxin [Rathayibacter toxicus]|uniref:Alkyl hydroperoxide reductase E n=1 Tax=Rathayibacter toxicus TaxID=145458 RepID=A0A0C5BH77_9MICO|nr:peroxiredoxin [Rathayibacter toxicus]AJM77530.1 peroxiredoxin [Rathayibacter toxicus]ALS56550.1 peroxiredoxin [Rathayibacter toxicus]KKM44647.1 peroxiredoxin [Rathayibacter toxicus]PPG21623.1 peroxiredoxin [Rathayibacter toxicus]PPG46585.1 peroxiredoxin [Rathayibacter toxicus]
MVLEKLTLAPDFELANQYGERIQLGDFRGRRNVALVFFPFAFSGTCSAEFCALRDNLAIFTDAEVELVGISVDSKHTLRSWGEIQGYSFTLLSDFWPHGDVAQQYGVLLEAKGYANRATFLIDREGVIRDTIVTAPGEARSLDAYRDAVAALAPARV